MIQPSEIFDCLIGLWSIERVVNDSRTQAEIAQMKGIAIFTPTDSNTIDYCETVSVQLAETTLPGGTREYIFRRLANGFAVYFKEKDELFHNMEFSEDNPMRGLGEATHICKADIYDSTYHFETPDRFEVLHKATGPNKRYVISSVYTRSG